MKISIKTLLLAASVSCSVLISGCSDGNLTTEVPQAEEIKVSPQSINFNWQKAYEEKLNEFKASADYNPDTHEGSRFDLFDITGDTTPELIISPNTQSQTPCRIYSCSNGEIIELGETGNCGTFYYLPELKLINDEYIGDSFILGKYISYENGVFETKLSYYDNSMAASSGASIYYQINDKEVLLPEYSDTLTPYKNSLSVCAGRKYTFGDSAMNYAIKCSESWGAVIRVKQRELYREKLLDVLNSAEINTYAFELCDLNADEVPELIISNGDEEVNTCEVYYYDSQELKQIEGNFGIYGKFTLDTEKFVISAGSVRWAINNSEFSAADYVFSESLAEIGRKYLLTEQNINFALN